MPITRPIHAFDQLAQKWRGLAERRSEHFAELYRTGRWRRYYTEDQFLTQMREAVRAAETWGEIVGSQGTAVDRPAKS